MLMPSAPNASAATTPRAPANPPEAITGNLDLTGCGRDQDQSGNVVFARLSGAFEPVDTDAVHTELLRLTARRTEVHLCGTLMPLP